MDEEWERQAGSTWELGAGSRLSVVASWRGADGGELRVVRWQLQGAVRDLYHWARGQSGAETGGPAEPDTVWVAGVALERRAGPTARWDTIRRQELTGADPAHFAARLHGWEAGLLDRATKLAGPATKRL
ncbi:MAG TPA: hypothetical protein VKY74_10480 [Chloroflexia bacterium]|nr:hypothetical protein [Chloroflexia bacterium]